MMNEITRLDVEIAKAKLGTVLGALDDARQADAIWKDLEMIKGMDRLWKMIENLQEKLDNSI